MNRNQGLVVALLLVLVATVAAPPAAEAIPAFARTYKISCTTCHAPFPRLKDFGEEFAGNGFTIPEQEKDRDFVTAGDDLLRLNKTFPLGGRFDAFAVYESNSDVETDLQIPYGLKLLSGGPLARNVGYYFYFYMSERGEVAGVEDAYIHFNNLGGTTFDIMVGQFQTSDPLLKRELRLTYEDYNIYKVKIGRSRNNLTYDRGVMMTYDIEKTGTGLVGMIVNGNGKEESREDRKFDDDKYKNFGFRISQDVAEPLRIGYFAYYGEEATLAAEDPAFRNRLLYHGPDLTLGNGTFDLNLQYLLRRDTNPFFIADAVAVETDGIVGELVIAPEQDRSRQYFTVLYNRVDSGLATETLTGSFTHLMARNLRLTVEYTYILDGEYDRMALGLVGGF